MRREDTERGARRSLREPLLENIRFTLAKQLEIDLRIFNKRIFAAVIASKSNHHARLYNRICRFNNIISRVRRCEINCLHVLGLNNTFVFYSFVQSRPFVSRVLTANPHPPIHLPPSSSSPVHPVHPRNKIKRVSAN